MLHTRTGGERTGKTEETVYVSVTFRGRGFYGVTVYSKPQMRFTNLTKYNF